MKQIGIVSNYFDHVGAAAIKLDANLKVGDKIKIKGGNVEFEQEVKEMPDEEVTNIYTVGEFANYIASKVNTEKGTNISFGDVMPDLLDVLEADYSVPRHKITLDSRFVQDLGFG